MKATPRIIPLVQCVEFPTEKQILRMFGLRNGKKTIRAKSLGEEKNKAIVAPKGDTMKTPVGLPGSKERINALREQYQILEANDESAFSVSDAQIVNTLADTAANKGWDFTE